MGDPRVRCALKHWWRRQFVEQYVVFGPRARFHCHETARLSNALINTHCGSVWIGEHAFMGQDVLVLTGTHDYSLAGYSRQLTAKIDDRDIVIGKGVWVASGAIIVGPCSIGENSVISSGCVIEGDIPPGVVVRLRQELEFEPIRFSDR